MINVLDKKQLLRNCRRWPIVSAFPVNIHDCVRACVHQVKLSRKSRRRKKRSSLKCFIYMMRNNVLRGALAVCRLFLLRVAQRFLVFSFLLLPYMSLACTGSSYYLTNMISNTSVRTPLFVCLLARERK